MKSSPDYEIREIQEVITDTSSAHICDGCILSATERPGFDCMLTSPWRDRSSSDWACKWNSKFILVHAVTGIAVEPAEIVKRFSNA